MVNYFVDFFTTVTRGMENVLKYIPRKVTEQQNVELLRIFTYDEVKLALFSMHPDKSPGPDGLNPGFFQAYWDVIGNDVVKWCNDFLETGKMWEGPNFIQLILIPKKAHPQTMADLRPITLCNVLYKVLAKSLANRIKPLLDNIISIYQSVFIPGRMISDNIIVAYETQHYLKRKMQGKEGYVAVKVDMSKAYDRVEWGFLKASM